MNVFLEFRQFANLSQTKAAAKIGVTRNCYSLWEHEKRRPGPEKAEKFVEVTKSYNFPVSSQKIYQRIYKNS
jgi:DNA-binding XRE family transcriptional regulator